MGKKGPLLFGVIILITAFGIGGWIWHARNVQKLSEDIASDTTAWKEYQFSDAPRDLDGWKVIRGSDSQWQNNQRDWMNISFQVPSDAKAEEVFIADSDDFHRLQVSLSVEGVPVSLNVLPLSSVFSKGGDVSVISSTFKDVEFGGFSEEFKHPYHQVVFSNMRGIEFDPIRQTFESHNDEYYRVYTLIKTSVDTKPDYYSIYEFSIAYPVSMNNQQKEVARNLLVQILNTVQAL